MDLLASLLQRLLLLISFLLPASVRWRVLAWPFRRAHALQQAALQRPDETQLATLRRILDVNRSTEFGRAHAFDRIADIETFRNRVPPRTYGELEPFIERHRRGEHPCREPAERSGGGDGGPEEAGDRAGGEVPRALERGQQAEGAAADRLGCPRGDGGMLCGLRRSDADPCEQESDREQRHARPDRSEDQVGGEERDRAEHEDDTGAAPVTEVAGRQARECRREVACDVEHHGHAQLGSGCNDLSLLDIFNFIDYIMTKSMTLRRT